MDSDERRLGRAERLHEAALEIAERERLRDAPIPDVLRDRVDVDVEALSWKEDRDLRRELTEQPLREAIEIARDVGSERAGELRARALWNLGRTLLVGDDEAASEAFSEAVERAEEVGTPRALEAATLSQGELAGRVRSRWMQEAIDAGEADRPRGWEASEAWRDATAEVVRLAKAAGTPAARRRGVEAAWELGRAAEAAGDDEEAEARWRDVLELSGPEGRVGAAELVAHAACHLARLVADDGDPVEAADLYERALDVGSRRVGRTHISMTYAATACVELGALHRDGGRKRKARRAWQAFCRVVGESEIDAEVGEEARTRFEEVVGETPKTWCATHGASGLPGAVRSLLWRVRRRLLGGR